MAQTSTISALIDSETRRRAESVFKELGLSVSQAITLFYEQVELRRELPFPVEVPGEITRHALEEAKNPEKLPRFESTQELFEDLEI